MSIHRTKLFSKKSLLSFNLKFDIPLRVAGKFTDYRLGSIVGNLIVLFDLGRLLIY